MTYTEQLITKKWERFSELIRGVISAGEFAATYPSIRDSAKKELLNPTPLTAYQPISIYTTRGTFTYHPREDRMERKETYPTIDYPEPYMQYYTARQSYKEQGYIMGTDPCKEEELTNKLLLLCH